MEKEGEQVAILDKRKLQPTVYGNLLRISIKVLGGLPSLEGDRKHDEAHVERPIEVPNCGAQRFHIYCCFQGGRGTI